MSKYLSGEEKINIFYSNDQTYKSFLFNRWMWSYEKPETWKILEQENKLWQKSESDHEWVHWTTLIKRHQPKWAYSIKGITFFRVTNPNSSGAPPYLSQGPPVLLNPERVVPHSDSTRYEQHFQPNVALVPRNHTPDPELAAKRRSRLHIKEEEKPPSPPSSEPPVVKLSCSPDIYAESVSRNPPTIIPLSAIVW